MQGLYQIPGLRYKSGKLENLRLKKIKDFINKTNQEQEESIIEVKNQIIRNFLLPFNRIWCQL